MARADPTATRRKREAGGRRAETAAAFWLQLKGYRILDWRPHAGLRDRPCRPQGPHAGFVEVKARRTQDMALEPVTPQLRKRLEQAANQWVSRRRGLQPHLWRFDIVMLVPGKLPRHMRDAWRAQA